MKNFSNELVEMTDDELMNVEGGIIDILLRPIVMQEVSDFCQGVWDAVRGY